MNYLGAIKSIILLYYDFLFFRLPGRHYEIIKFLFRVKYFKSKIMITDLFKSQNVTI